MAQPVQPDRTRRRLWPTKRWARRLLWITALVLVAGGVTLVVMLRSTPSFWREHQAMTTQERQAAAEQAQAKLDALIQQAYREPHKSSAFDLEPPMEERYGPFAETQPKKTIAHATQPDTAMRMLGVDPADIPLDIADTLTLTNAVLAAIIAVHFPQWLDDRGYVLPSGIREPMAAAHNGKLHFAFAYRAGAWSQVFSGDFRLTMLPSGMAELRLGQMRAGNVPLPLHSVGDFIAARVAPEHRGKAEEVGDWLNKLRRIEIRPVIKLEHRRRARITNYRVLSEGVELTVRIQDHRTYKNINRALAAQFGPPDHYRHYYKPAPPEAPTAIADVPTD